MSTNYTETLKRIKDAEEASNREVSEKKKSLEAELLSIEQAADKSIEDAKKEAEAYVAKEDQAAKDSSQAQADALLASTREKAEEISSKRLDGKELRKIVDEILFSEFKEG
jgi:vacuolar-type H+-ATPase subunit H